MISYFQKISRPTFFLTSIFLFCVATLRAQQHEPTVPNSIYIQPSFGLFLGTADGLGNGSAQVEILSGHKAGLMVFMQGANPIRLGIGATYIRQSFSFSLTWLTGVNSPFENGSIYNKFKQNTTYFGIPLELQIGNFRSTDWARHSFYASVGFTPAIHGGTRLNINYNEPKITPEERQALTDTIQAHIPKNTSFLELGIGGALLLGENQKTGLGLKVSYLHFLQSLNTHFIENQSGIKVEISLTVEL